MIKPNSSIAASVLILAMAPVAAFAGAQDGGEAEGVHRLSPEEMAEISASSEEPRIETGTLQGNNSDGLLERRIRSEVSLGIGTNGYRELSVSTLIPLGDNGLLALGFGRVEDNLQRRYHNGRGLTL